MSKNSIASTPNPYDFANPVMKQELFAGRRDELKDIKYYLEHARSSERCINLALLGDRASGKTSLLNIIEIEANNLNLTPVRIDLNECDVESPMAFCYKLFDSILTVAVETPARDDNDSFTFGGIYGGTYQTYVEMTTSFDVPEDKLFCPFLFPIQYARASVAPTPSTRVSDQVLKRDLKAVAAEVARPIVLLVDECNVLSAHRNLLELLRNTFMNLPGYMLVLAGTPDLFPVIDDVFSPIIRQFKQVEVRSFRNLRDTIACIDEPLKRLGLEELRGYEVPPEWVLESLPADSRSYLSQLLDDLHELTGGRPYEIQLVSHLMFRRVQEGLDEKMSLGLDVLEDVLRELRRHQDIDQRPIITAFRGLDDTELEHLMLLVRSAGRVRLEELYFAHQATVGGIARGDLEATVERLEGIGVLSRIDDCVEFCGDDFDRIFCRYLSSRRRKPLIFEPLGVVWHFRRMVSGKGLRSPFEAGGYGDLRTMSERSDFVCQTWSSMTTGSAPTTLLDAPTDISLPIYQASLDLCTRGIKRIKNLFLRVQGPGINYCDLFQGTSGDADENLSKAVGKLERASSRIDDIGKIEWEVVECDVPSIAQMEAALAESTDHELTRRCARLHSSEMLFRYIEGKLDLAYAHARIAASSHQFLAPDPANNVAFVLISEQQYDLAESVLDGVIERERAHALAKYNRAMLYARAGQIQDALRLITEAIALNESKPTEVVALLVPQLNGAAVDLEVLGGKSKELSFSEVMANSLELLHGVAQSQ